VSGRAQPEHGADSAEAYVLKPFLVLMRDPDGGRHEVRIRKALGPNDARSQARHQMPDCDPIRTIEEASLDYQDAEHERAVRA
jgi:hypothetical protein